jgi:fatty-acyl-CoA synthase
MTRKATSTGVPQNTLSASTALAKPEISATMMGTPLSINQFLGRAKSLFSTTQIVSRLPDKSLRYGNFGEFYDRSLRFASALIALGIQPGQRVATLCWNHQTHLECYFGIPAARAVMHTLNLRLSAPDIAWIAQDAQDTVLIVDDVLLPLYAQVASQYSFKHVIVYDFQGNGAWRNSEHASSVMLDYDELLNQHIPLANALPHHEDDPIAMCYTSGTTGRSKGVVYSHRSTVLHTLVASLSDNWGLSNRDVVLPVTPMFHANCWGIPYGAVMLGSKLVFPGPHLHPNDLLDLMQIEPPTLSLGVPTIWLGLMQTFEAEPGRWKMPAMRSLVGGAAVPEAMIRSYARHGVSIIQGWGMTETSPLATTSYIKSELAYASEDEQFKRKSLAGIPAPLVDIRLRGETDKDQPSLEDQPMDGKSVGEIQVRGPFITGQYHQVPIELEKFTEDGWLRTGDVASFNTEGYLRITDRTKDLIKSGGEWISSVDMENALMAHPAIFEAAVIAIPDAKWSERPLACLVAKPGTQVDIETLKAFLLTKGFAKWQVPDRFEWLEQIPRTSTGKFWKLRLRALYPN